MYRILFSLFLLLAPLSFSGMSQAVDIVSSKAEYSADSYFELAELKIKSKVHRAPGKERSEIDTGGGRQIIIQRQDKKVSWMLMPSQSFYIESPMQDGPAGVPGYKIEKSEVVGEETIDGLKTTKSKTIMSDDKGNKFGGFIWATKEGIMVKMDAISVDAKKGEKRRMKMELKNIQLGKQDPKLFEIPAGFSKMNMGGLGSGGMNLKDKKK